MATMKGKFSERGQMLVFFSLVVATVLASISVLHAQNILAGMESSRTLMVFPKEEIRNLKNIGEYGFMQFTGQHITDFYSNTNSIREQIQLLYAQKGIYGDVVAYFATPESSVECYSVRIVYVSGEVSYNEELYCCEGRGCV